MCNVANFASNSYCFAVISETRNRMIFRTVTLALIAAAVSSCAFTKETVSLSYTPQPAPPVVPGASTTAVKVAVADERADQSKISVKKNGYGMEAAPIASSAPVANLFKTAIEAELRNRGFSLGDGKMLSVSVDRFYNDFKTGFWAGEAVGELEMHVAVGSYRRPIKTSFRHAVQVYAGANAKQALEGALQEATAKLFADREFISAILTK